MQHFFTRDRQFYRTLFAMLAVVALQNLVAYSVNMVDNMMLGSYSQQALSGAATVNQIFFIIQQLTIGLGNGLVAIASQYWGRQERDPIRRLSFMTIRLTLILGLIIVAVCSLFPAQILGIFTTDQAIIAQGVAYMRLIKWTFLLYMITNVFMAALRSVGVVGISFYISVVSLLVNCSINYTLIFGRFGFPEMGIAGAAIGTLIARILELLIVLIYLLKKDIKLQLFAGKRTGPMGEVPGAPAAKAAPVRPAAGGVSSDKALLSAYVKVTLPLIASYVLWAFSVPMQTAVLGHLSADAIAANSVATTFYQYLKVVVTAMSSVSAVLIGNAIGRGDLEEVRAQGRTLSVLDIGVGLVLAGLLLLFKGPLLSVYVLSDEARRMAGNIMTIMSVIMIGMSYQMPVCAGIISGAGDTGYMMRLNLIFTWGLVIPLSCLAAFVLHWPVELVVIVAQSDQIIKCLPVFLKFRRYGWIRKLT